MDIFEKFLNTVLPDTGETIGKNVKVTTRTPKIVDGEEVVDEDEQPIMDEEKNTLFAHMDLIKGTEQIVEGLILKPGDCIGYFQKKDVEYLNSDSYVDLTIHGIDFHFKIIDVIPEAVNIVVPMKKVE